MSKKTSRIYRIILFVSVMINSYYCVAQKVEIGLADTNMNKGNQKITSYITPAVFVLYGFLEPHVNALIRLDKNTNAELREDHPYFSTPIDNYLRYAPALAVYGMDVLGLKAKNNVIDRSVMLLIATTITSTSVTFSKNNISRIRPGGGNHSFPSSHTAMAFMTAELMHQEYKDEYPLISLLGYATATATGVLRLYNGAHWVSDIVAGAGYGILSAKISYLLYPVLKQMVYHENPVNLVLLPIRQSSYTGFVLIHSFN